jgi:hypothetical protein
LARICLTRLRNGTPEKQAGNDSHASNTSKDGEQLASGRHGGSCRLGRKRSGSQGLGESNRHGLHRVSSQNRVDRRSGQHDTSVGEKHPQFFQRT